MYTCKCIVGMWTFTEQDNQFIEWRKFIQKQTAAAHLNNTWAHPGQSRAASFMNEWPTDIIEMFCRKFIVFFQQCSTRRLFWIAKIDIIKMTSENLMNQLQVILKDDYFVFCELLCTFSLDFIMMMTLWKHIIIQPEIHSFVSTNFYCWKGYYKGWFGVSIIFSCFVILVWTLNLLFVCLRFNSYT